MDWDLLGKLYYIAISLLVLVAAGFMVFFIAFKVIEQTVGV